MGWLESLTDVFTGRPAQEAAAKQRAFLDQTRATGNTDITNALTSGTGAIRAGTATARGDIGTGFADASGYLTGAGAAFDPVKALASKYGAGTDLYLAALGIGGPEAMSGARDAFKTTDAYNFNLDQGLEAIMRNRNARGEVAGGNADRDAQTFGAGLASQEYGSWLDRLAGMVNPELTATTTAATGVAGLGRDQANLASQRGTMLADLASREGTSLAGLQTGAAGQKVGLATSLADPYARTYGEEAAAEMKGSGNLWNLGMNALALGTGQFGKMNAPSGGSSFVPVPKFGNFNFG